MSHQLIVAIGRESGSGGLDIAHALAERLQLPLFDKSILQKAAEDKGVSAQTLERYDERPYSPLFCRSVRGISSAPEDCVAQMQFELLRQHANAGESFVVLGRCAEEVLADREGACISILKPDAVVDAILAKRNLGTRITDAPAVIGVGPGFTAGTDCHAVVETMRGHTLGRAIYQGGALPNTNIPGLIGGYAGERVLRAPADGVFHQLLDIGAAVKAGDVAGEVNGIPMRCTIDGVVRGILPEGTPVHKGMKSGDVDPRCRPEYCTTASDKALAVGGGVLEALLHLRVTAKQND